MDMNFEEDTYSTRYTLVLHFVAYDMSVLPSTPVR